MNRRNFLGAMLAACAAPAVVRAGSLMRINPVIILPKMEIGRIEGFRIITQDHLAEMTKRRIDLAMVQWRAAIIEGHDWKSFK